MSYGPFSRPFGLRRTLFLCSTAQQVCVVGRDAFELNFRYRVLTGDGRFFSVSGSLRVARSELEVARPWNEGLPDDCSPSDHLFGVSSRECGNTQHTHFLQSFQEYLFEGVEKDAHRSVSHEIKHCVGHGCQTSSLTYVQEGPFGHSHSHLALQVSSPCQHRPNTRNHST